MKVMERFTGGRGPMLAAAAVGAVGLGVTGLGLAVDTRRALFGYLFAFAYWAGIAVASLVLLGAWHASRARWPVVLRRMLETMAATLPLFALLLPLAVLTPVATQFELRAVSAVRAVAVAGERRSQRLRPCCLNRRRRRAA